MALIANLKAGKLIALQNILFKTNEKKLQVSKDFLETVAQNYINKQMKTVNNCIETVYTTKSPKVFFNDYDLAVSTLDELVVMEEYYDFKFPGPSDYKKRFVEKTSENIECMIGRLWRSVQNSITPESEEDKINKYNHIFEKLLSYRNKMSQENIETINQLHISVFGTDINGNKIADEEQDTAAQI